MCQCWHVLVCFFKKVAISKNINFSPLNCPQMKQHHIFGSRFSHVACEYQYLLCQSAQLVRVPYLLCHDQLNWNESQLHCFLFFWHNLCGQWVFHKISSQFHQCKPNHISCIQFYKLHFLTHSVLAAAASREIHMDPSYLIHQTVVWRFTQTTNICKYQVCPKAA